MRSPEKGHEVRQVVNILHRATKDPLPMFYVDLEPKHNNKDVFEVKNINNMKVTIEAPYKKKSQEILQCKRCQRFGHTKNQCHRPFRCVKCGEEHPTKTCVKKSDTDATCANCLEKHPASYKGCKTYKQYKEKILKTTLKPTEKQQPPNHTFKPESYKQNHELPMGYIPNKTYAEATKPKYKMQNENLRTANSAEANINLLLENMFEKMQQTMMAMIENMMEKMMNSIVQLVTSLTKK